MATALEIPLATGRVRAEGDLDFRGTLGVDREAPGRLRRHPPRASSSTTTRHAEQLATLLKLTERYCVVYQTLAHATAVTAAITTA